MNGSLNLDQSEWNVLSLVIVVGPQLGRHTGIPGDVTLRVGVHPVGLE